MFFFFRQVERNCFKYKPQLFLIFSANISGADSDIPSSIASAFEKENGTDKKIYSLNVYDFENWDTSLYGEIVFTLAIKFDYSLLEEYINVNCVSNKEFIFSNIVIRELEKQEAIE